MPRIQPVTTPSPEAKEMLKGIEAKIGMVPNIHKTMAHSVATLGMYLGGSGALGNSTLGAALCEQIALTVAGANGCDYCSSAHTMIAKRAKVAESELPLNLQGKSADAKVQAALTFARKVNDQRGNVTNADVDAVRKAGYTEGEILDIVSVVSFNIFTNYVNHVAETAIDFPLVSTADISKAA